MDAETQISLLVDRLAGANEQIAQLKSALAASEAESKKRDIDLNAVRGSCKALGVDLGLARRRITRFHRALTWLAQAPTVRLADDTPAWVTNTLKSALVHERLPSQSHAEVANG